ncbi:hypothetical protein LTR37_019789 [Vermiconidia calcicola]|uniref:Uncharacterized protein n=1 Tax=Vermiconidia calcicola TaxID=1690605 RepID=A0ACC3MEZ0_9PEZI|nr:hypothetical protein LTR37_019789 [Vermiconidia calcicola]
MAFVTHPKFDANTEGLEVAKAFSAEIRGKTVLVTGVNRGGIGFSTSHAFASQCPAHLIVAGRSKKKIQDSIHALKDGAPDVDFRALVVDLSSQKSVRSAAAEVLSWDNIPSIDIVVNSAGVMCIEERTLSPNGVEMHFATNHIGHWLLTCLIMPKLIKAAKDNPKGATRVVNVTSASPMVSGIRWSDINFDKKNKDLPEAEQPNYEWFKPWGYTDLENKSYLPLDGYNRSKVANVLFGIAANEWLYEKYGILTLAVHPGVIETELGRNFSTEQLESIKAMIDKGIFTYKTLGAGASTSLIAALDPGLRNGVGQTLNGSENWGSYLADCQISNQADPRSVSSGEAEKLWALSETLVGEAFAW